MINTDTSFESAHFFTDLAHRPAQRIGVTFALSPPRRKKLIDLIVKLFCYVSPLNLVDILAREEIDDTLPDVLVDGHVKDGIDEAVAVGQNHHVSHQFSRDFVAAARSAQHEEEGIGPPADQEGGSDASHDQSDPSEVLVILPNIKTVIIRRC